MRTNYPGSAHKDASDIWLRYNDITTSDPALLKEEMWNGKEMVNHSAIEFLTETHSVIHELMYMTGGERLGRVLLTKIPPGGKIKPHIDEGETALYYDRFHVVIKEGGVFTVGDETAQMKPGEIWWFNNQECHSVDQITEERIHLIIDIKLMNYSPFYLLKRHSYRKNYV